MHSSFEISPATIEEAEELNVLINAAYRGESSRKGWTTEADLLDGTRTDAELIRQIIQTPATTLLSLRSDGEILGCVELRKETEKMYLGMLTVRPDLQGQGIGKVLMKTAEDFALENGCSTMYMTVLVPRTELIAWYVRHGYVDTGQRKPFAFNDPRFGQPRQSLEFTVLVKSL
ncbi:GNAT family N-acetyltransferase [Fulvivirga sedimenti]|uniref:GNAT family N-acetyltransferase n=1 Tax=Fulvivirga sedimenti TaxID=2879465 RepID=A0A9X1KUZ0_9BACT|nr:GNAT family N-acetyltransferase [Fulvivirga sedimenti]MCA6074088.1 GNAT family N-acetyltransferase [Fulvivirga sedimenti]